VGGGGRVGLPLGIVLATAGNKVSIIDLDQARNEHINNRKMPFFEKGAADLLTKLSLEDLSATNDNSEIKNSDACILIIGTPVLEDGTPSANSLIELVRELIPNLTNVKLLLLRSTVYPGITNKIKELLKSFGLNTAVSFCPERIAEGNAIQELKVLPQIIGAFEQEAIELSTKLFSSIGSSIIITSIEEAELTKLFANSYRYLQFAIANEFYEICQSKDINWENVWNALQSDYPRASGLPKPGFAAGPCLVKDTQQLNYYYEDKFKLGKSALNVNENFPEFLVSQLKQKFNLKNITVGILGMTFKGDVDDFRSSLSFKLRKILALESKSVLCSDALLTKDYFVSESELLEKSDVIIIATPHSKYQSLQIEKPVVDIWRISQSKSLF
jgi:UDP-N-acetyl-D-mannosaminuronic acid dehydrogenase